MKKVLKGLAVALATLSASLLVGCGEEKKENLIVCMPDGAPAMAFASLMQDGMDGVEFQVVAPTAIATKISNLDESKNADLCVLPITAASKKLGDGEKYKMLSMITSGNLYLLSKDESVINGLEQSEYKDLSSLVGKTVGVMQMTEMPGLTFKWSIENYGLAWHEVKNDGVTQADKINLKGIGGVADMAVNDLSAYLVAEPAASVQLKQGFTSVCSLETLYCKGEGSVAGYPQAVLVAKKDLVENSAFIEEFLGKVEKSAKALSTLSGAQIVSAIGERLEDKDKGTLKAELLTKETVARCGVRFMRAADCKAAVLSYVENIRSVDNNKMQAITENFFYL